MKDVTITNNEYTIQNYKTFLELGDVKATTIDVKIYTLIPFFRFLNNKKADEVTKRDVENYFIYLKRSKKKKTTQLRDFTTIRAFFKWLIPGNNFFENIKIKKEKPDTSTKQYVDVEDVKVMLGYCTNQRDRVLLLLMWETGARLGELLSLNIRDVKPHKYGITVTVTGKTGTRDILIVDSVPDIQAWLNMRPAVPDAPLFPVIGRHRKGRLHNRGALSIVKGLAKQAGIEKRIWCHGFRHGRLTELSNAGLSEMQLRLYAGWTNESEMPAVYLHPTKEDVFNKLLRLKGIEVEETTQETVKILSTKKCSRCGAENAFDAKFCSKCSMVIDQMTAMNIENDKSDIDEIKKELARAQSTISEIEKLYKEIRNTPEGFKMGVQVIKKSILIG